MAGLATLEFSGERLEPPRFAFSVQLLVHPFGKPVQLPARHTIFVFGVVLGINFDGTKGDHLAVNRYADIFSFQAALEPRAQILPGVGNGQCFHKDILMSLLRLSSAAQRQPARVARRPRWVQRARKLSGAMPDRATGTVALPGFNFGMDDRGKGNFNCDGSRLRGEELVGRSLPRRPE